MCPEWTAPAAAFGLIYPPFIAGWQKIVGLVGELRWWIPFGIGVVPLDTGMQTYGANVGVSAQLECPSCHERVSASVKVARYYLFVFWLPLLPLNKRVFAHCLSHGAACSDLGTWTAMPNAMSLSMVESVGAGWDYKAYRGFNAWFRGAETSYLLPLLFALPCAFAVWAAVGFLVPSVQWSSLGFVFGWISGLIAHLAIVRSNANGSVILAKYAVPPKPRRQRVLFRKWRQRRLLAAMEGQNPKANDAAEMLVDMGDPSIVPDLLGKLYWVENDNCIWLTLEALSKLGDNAIPEKILERMTPRVQFAVPLTEAFSRLGASDNEWFELLSQISVDDHYPDDMWDPRYERQRIEAINQLPRYGTPALAVLQKLAGDENDRMTGDGSEEIRRAAAAALAGARQSHS